MIDFNVLEKMVRGSVNLNVMMKDYTSMCVGGPCVCLFTPEDKDDLLKFIDWARSNSQRYLVIGAGTNILVKDGGIKLPLIRIKDTLDSIEVENQDDVSVTLKVGAGKPLAGIVKYCADNGFTGIEPLAGIPGTLGGAIYMNAGTGKETISDVIEAVTFIERTGKIKTFEKDDMGFGYRKCSALSTSTIVTSAVIKLGRSSTVKVQKRVEEIVKNKAQIQPLNYPSAGSIFKNLKKKKAWEMLDEAGMRGVRVRNAKYSELHTNFIINTGGATATDVLALIDAGMEKVKEKTGLKLELEVIIVGEDQ
ncbi:MAG: UDP-N-acetylmuramate dehydrogenase [Deltaproteobacteria bacterium]|nr:UDP-N-acetylmuramate dehydrogenase [Deltaproteobacteria bacterium]MCL5792466.1 UDP-N-acetylmuramate dehydrogenase [Deltaproteobacteria bacterium]